MRLSDTEGVAHSIASRMQRSAWARPARLDRTVSKNLTLQYDKVLFILEPNEITRSLACKRVVILDYPDGRFAIRHAWTSLIGPSTSGRRSIRLPSSRTSALVRCLPTSPRSRRSWTCRGRPRHRGDVASAITCSRSDSAEQGPSTPKPGKAATLHPKTVTFVTGAKSDFSKWRRQPVPVPWTT